MDKRQNICEASAGQVKGFAKGANLLRDWRQSIALATVPLFQFLCHTRRSRSLRFLLRLLGYFRTTILLNLCALLPVRGSNAIGTLLEGQLEG